METDEPTLKPVVVVVGSTGVGKTKLSIDLAQMFSGEIIGADSMQVYRGLDVGSAKPTPDELSAAPHHMVGVVPPTHAFDVHQYVAQADRCIADIHARGKLPIICGGTFYYIEQLLFHTLITESALGADSATTTNNDASINQIPPLPAPLQDLRNRFPLLPGLQRHLRSLPDSDLCDLLALADPRSAHALSAQNRKLRRALEFLITHGRTQAAAQAESGGQRGSRLRYRPLVVWLMSDAAALARRCESRIGAMVRGGVVGEVWDLMRLYVARMRRGLPCLSSTQCAYGRLGPRAGEGPADDASAAAADDSLYDASSASDDEETAEHAPAPSAPALPLPWGRVDPSVGLCQAIGMKEFLPWASLLQHDLAQADKLYAAPAPAPGLEAQSLEELSAAPLPGEGAASAVAREVVSDGARLARALAGTDREGQELLNRDFVTLLRARVAASGASCPPPPALSWRVGLLRESVAQLGLATAQYTRYQARWVSQRLTRLVCSWGADADAERALVCGLPLPSAAPMHRWRTAVVRLDTSRIAPTAPAADTDADVASRGVSQSRSRRRAPPPLLSADEIAAAAVSPSSPSDTPCAARHALTGRWDADVLRPAAALVHSFLEGPAHLHEGQAEEADEEVASHHAKRQRPSSPSASAPPVPACLLPYLVIARPPAPEEAPPPRIQHRVYRCEVCRREISGDNNWAAHCSSKPHLKLARRAARESTKETI